MTAVSFAGHQPPVAIDLNQPGTYVHWSIFDLSVANLVLVAVMVVIFGAALLIPFPHGKKDTEEAAASAERRRRGRRGPPR